MEKEIKYCKKIKMNEINFNSRLKNNQANDLISPIENVFLNSKSITTEQEEKEYKKLMAMEW